MNRSSKTGKHSPIGIFAVVLGPDGSGKSTIVDRLLLATETQFAGSWRFHWRPGLLPQPGRQRKKQDSGPPLPPNEYAYGSAISFLRYCYFLTDFVFGYWLRIYPRRRRGQLVLGERWYFDVLINPQRYGFRLPTWLLRLGGYLIPKPDLTLLLSAEPAAIHARKPELTVDQISAQIVAMRNIIDRSPHGTEIATDTPLEESVASVVAALSTTTERLRGQDVWRAFPPAGNAKLLISDNTPMKIALRLYGPYSHAGRVAKSLAARLPRQLSTRRLPASAPHDELVALSRFIRGVMGGNDTAVSYSTGTPGPHRKMTAQVFSQGRVAAYVKVARSPAAIELVDNEAAALRGLELKPNARISTPRVIAQTTHDHHRLLFLSAPDTEAQARPLGFDDRDIAFIDALTPDRPESRPLASVWETLVADRHEKDPLVRDAGAALTELVGTTGVRTGPAHGDYAPWNTLQLADGRLFVFDWEYFSPDAPLLGDLFQRAFMPDWLVRKLAPSTTVVALIALQSDPRLTALLKRLDVNPREFAACLLLYLLRQGLRNADDQGISSYLRSCLQLALADREAGGVRNMR